MKLLVSLFVIAVLSFGTYQLTFVLTNKKKKSNGNKTTAVGATILVCILLFGFLAFSMYRNIKALDLQCATHHVTMSEPPRVLVTAMDYFEEANYEYDTGNCWVAILDYNKSIEMNPEFAQAYNNRAYTYMRMRNYSAALPDLDKAIKLKPDYIQALMNRGDIHNYYYQIDRPLAVKDYEKVIALGGKDENSVCGHIFLARNNGWALSTFLSLPKMLLMNRCN